MATIIVRVKTFARTATEMAGCLDSLLRTAGAVT